MRLLPAASALTLGLMGFALGNQPDVLFPDYLPPSECPDGCAAWPTGFPYNNSVLEVRVA